MSKPNVLDNFEDYVPKKEQTKVESVPENEAKPMYEPTIPPIQPIKKLPTPPQITETKKQERKRKKVFWKIFASILGIGILLILGFIAYTFYDKDFNSNVDITNNPPTNEVNINPTNEFTHEITNNIEIILDEDSLRHLAEDIADDVFTQLNESLNLS